MQVNKFLLIGALSLLVSGCSCRAKKAGVEDGNIPVAEAGQDIYFDFDSYALTAEAKTILDQHAANLKEHADKKVQVEGHCDERGTNEYNMVLGANRARSSLEYLRSLGVEPSRMSTVSYGEELPADPRHNEEAWAKNRRDHFNLDVK